MSDHFATDPLPPLPETRHLADLEAELTTLTGHINAAICRFLVVLEAFDRLKGYQRHGLVSSAHWLNWRCGFGLNAAREKVRVARALPELPGILARFETGELSYSKVRAMTRVATPENEEVLLQVARYGTAHHVETLVSKWRGAERARELQRAGRRHAGRSLVWHYDDEGCLVIRATLPPEQGAVVIEALRAAMARMEEEGASGDGRDVTAETPQHENTETRPDANVTAETSGRDDSTARSDANGSAETRHEDCYGSEAVSGVTAETSADDDSKSGTEPGATATTSRHDDSTARPDANGSAETRHDDCCGSEAVSDVTADTFHDRYADTGPKSTASAASSHREGELPDCCRGVTAETSDPEQAERPSLGQRRADALVFLTETWLAGAVSSAASGDRYLVTVHIDEEALASAAAGRSELQDGPGLAAETVRRLCCDGGIVTSIDDQDGRPLNVGRKTRAIPPAMRRALRHRDRCCRFPGCTRSRWLDGHHVVHWADGGETSLQNLVRLCHHHHRLVHEGGFGAHLDVAGEVRFTTPAGAVIPDAPTGPSLDRPLQIELEAFQRQHRLEIDQRTAECRWRGETMDYDHVGMLLGQAASRVGGADLPTG